MNELESWKKQEVYCEEKDISQSCISVDGLSARKLKMKKMLQKSGSVPAASKKLKTSLQTPHAVHE